MNKSESIKSLSKALSNLQGEIENPHNTADNPFFKSKYAPLPDVLKLARPLLKKHGLSVIQSPGSSDGKSVVITTLLMHESGEWVELDPLALTAEKMTPQGAGSAITYGRRYVIGSLLGISSEDDDDGNSLEGKAAGAKNQKASDKPPVDEKSVEQKVGQDHIKALMAKAAQKGDNDAAVKEKIMKAYGIESKKDLTIKQFNAVMKAYDKKPDVEKASEEVAK